MRSIAPRSSVRSRTFHQAVRIALRCATADACKCVERGLVGVGQGVQVPGRCSDVSVTEPLLHDLQVGAARQQLRRVRVSQVVHPDMKHQTRFAKRGKRAASGP
jgi:hypothetical protein